MAAHGSVGRVVTAGAVGRAQLAVAPDRAHPPYSTPSPGSRAAGEPIVRFLIPCVMKEQLLSIIMNDGSRHFGDLPQTVLWHELRDHIGRLDGAVVTDFVTDNVTEAWIDFTYRTYRFSVNDQMGEYWFFVDNPNCPDEALETVLSHCELLLGSGRPV